MIFTTGLCPLNEPERAYPIFHCSRCYRPIIWAWDDMFPDHDSELLKRAVELEELPPERGHVVLWYPVDEHGTPVGRQMFQRWDPRTEYAGPTWRLHLSTCEPRKGGPRHGNR
jgi:hypothetical protein